MNKSNKAGLTLWFTGLSGAGKSTLATAFQDKLNELYGEKYPSFIFDGDVIRKGLNKDLGFSKSDRAENIRRISEVSKLFNMSGQISIVSFISPYESERDFARTIHKESALRFLEVHIATSLEVCENRDVKGLYKKARQGEIKNFTGISDPYEEPKNPELRIDTANRSIDDCLEILFNKLHQVGYLSENKFSKAASASKLTDLGLEIDVKEMNWLQVFQQGWAPPQLKCFMNEEELLECLYFKTVTKNGEKALQSLPIIFPINQATNEQLKNLQAKNVNLVFNGKVVATVNGLSTYPFKKDEISAKLFGTDSNLHPKVALFNGMTHLVTGESLTFSDRVVFRDGLDEYRLSPQEISEIAKKKNADCIYAFQLRNPLHNGHCLLLNDTRKKLIAEGYKNPILLLHPCGGWTKDDDVPLDVRVEQHRQILKNGVLDPETTILSVWPAPMFYAGPLEVLYHFSSRSLAGVNFMIVGRDPAGLRLPDGKNQDLYDPTHGAKVLKIASSNGLLKQTNVIPFRVAVYNKQEQKMEYFEESRKHMYENISGTIMRGLAREDKPLPIGFMDPDGWKVLVDYYKSLN